MFRTFFRKFFPNKLDFLLKKTKGRKVLLGWNRGLGDIALGLYAIVHRIREYIPDAEITFVTRENLRDGFSLLEGVKVIVAPNWKRGLDSKIKDVVDINAYDLVIEKPSPTDWVSWQRGKITPRLKWDSKYENLYEQFHLPKNCIGVQVVAETNYGLWRNWPQKRWEELFKQCPRETFLLFGFGDTPQIKCDNVIDLRGKTTLFELLSIIKNGCQALVLPDSGILSMVYYLDEAFPIKVVSLWADPHHGILKQAVASPNPQLISLPIVAENKDLSSVSAQEVVRKLFPATPLLVCGKNIKRLVVKNVGCILLAGGQGSRLGFAGPKGLFPIRGKSLFAWIAEKVPKNLPLAVMTSPLNHEETLDHFEKNNYFGLDVSFFQQEMKPLLDEKKRPLKLLGPNGNGSVFRSFGHSGIEEKWQSMGIDLISVMNIDNPLGDPFDCDMISYAREEKADITIRCIERLDGEMMGALIERCGKIEIIEYTQLDAATKYKYAYSGQMVFDTAFFGRMKDVDLPVHLVKKKAYNQDVWKEETFIFDVLPYASKTCAIAAERKTCYAPLKGIEHLATIEKIL